MVPMQVGRLRSSPKILMVKPEVPTTSLSPSMDKLRVNGDTIITRYQQEKRVAVGIFAIAFDIR